MNKGKWILAVVLVFVLGLGAAWAMWPNAQVAKAKELQAEMLQLANDSQGDFGHHRQQFEKIRAEIAELPPDLQHKVMQTGQQMWRGRMEKKIKDYLALPENQRQAALDKDIQEMEAMRKKWNQRRAQDERTVASAAGSQAVGGGGNNGGGPGGNGGPGWGGQRTDQDRQKWMRNLLDNTTPQERAEFGAYFSDINARRQQLGFGPIGPGGR